MRRRLLLLALLSAAALALAWRVHERALPQLEPALTHLPVGVFHARSGSSTHGVGAAEELARVARARGLAFVVLTDPNAQLAAPMVRDGVVILSYAELATPHGLVVQLGAAGVLPPAQREAHDVLGAVRAAGGVPIISHPSDVKRPWTGELRGAGGLEIASAAAAARRYAGPFALGLVALLAVAPLRPDLALAQLYERDREALLRWDDNPSAAFVGLCGVDTLDRLAPGRALDTWRVVLEEPLPEAIEQRAPAILAALTGGRFYCAAGLFGATPYFRFGARDDNRWLAGGGGTVGLDEARELVVLGPAVDDDAPRLVLLRNGDEVARVRGRELRYREPPPGTYRAEVRVPVPELVSGERLASLVYSNKLRVVAQLPPAP